MQMNNFHCTHGKPPKMLVFFPPILYRVGSRGGGGAPLKFEKI